MTGTGPHDGSPIGPLLARRVIAVLRAPSPDAAVRAADALVAGGVTALEITYSTPDAPAVITELRGRHPGALTGAGTVRTEDEAARAAAAGAQFLVSPGSRQAVVAAMAATGLPVASGALTPTEVMDALAAGAHAVKLFPASLHGPALVKSLRGPFPDVAFIPTGGVHAGNAADWIAAGAAAVGAGSELCGTADMREGRWAAVTERARALAAAAGERADG
ncbi:bifunctional 4-hydroxy-2-oxoglutarate aldolase/2-dehydro-3-deoxy-phosphogluconate aldolase [Allonocardiopsis opalescens]|uniref:2-dehydro-3-deoxyphosphogluconate aldolase/(4S)-4-hydroxy-2-oxoglutarate aldolase n=1 Tax=Allonocardiopsis opalescens TaxID=1144618 RepID=A0A2T0Q0F5_9ACTN|nr:bifunctional 4-hydroxy-2-oxoglutarate aldolase/2-dehydro-3-deoxy-phosphogluconate aldolase [Allonocardiopsis opalescens]PRX97264.1 2-dehydro-3-deoxyphosphogluconate aldolase/(4S)-4-hydroxy-2-oxoglutarate aldolase [Allonocardiopsis opalescens]